MEGPTQKSEEVVMKSSEKQSIPITHIITHPMRYKIIETLSKQNEPMFIEQIADKIGADRRLVSFHLATMMEHGLVEGEYKVSELPASKGKAVKYYKLSRKAEQVFSQLAKITA